MKPKLLITLSLAVLLSQTVNLGAVRAMGELERIGGFVLNFATLGTLQAELEAEKNRLTGERIRKQAEFKLELERGKMANYQNLLQEQIDSLAKQKRHFENLKTQTISLANELQDSLTQLTKFRQSWSESSFSVEELAQAIRLEEQGSNPQTLAELKHRCERMVPESRGINVYCRVVALISGAVSAAESMTSISDADLQKSVRQIMRLKSKATAQEQMINLEIQFLDASAMTLKKQLEQTKGKSS